MNRAEVIARIRSVEPALRAHGVGSLYLFGSYARDQARADSDVDVFVDPADDPHFGFGEFMSAFEALEKAFPGTTVAYGTRDGLSKYLRPAIEREAVRVF